MAKKSFSFKAKHKSKKGGLTEAGRKAHNRATGSNLKRPQPEGGSRKKSYCARSKGQMNDHNIDCKKTPDKRICLARRRWKCNKSLQKSDVTPKQKLAMFLREHLDNKLALKAAEPAITKSNTSYSESLEKGARGDWEKEGHVLSHAVEDDGTVIVKARHPKYGLSGKAVLTPEVNHDGKTVYYPGWVGTEAWARRKGLATAMLNHAKQNGFELSNTIDLSSDGRAFAEAYKQKFGKSTLKKDLLPGGKGDTKDISDFDAREAEMGMKVELEHTKDINVAKEIVADHLSEDPAYYSKLKDSGLADELEKGLKGDWEKEGYTISHKNSPHGGIYVQAHDKHGKLAGFASIGYHDWDNSEDSEGVPIFSKTPTDHIMSYETEVEPAHQRKGLASAMYQYAEQYYGVPMEMGSLSDDAAKLWRQPRRPFGKSTLEKAGRCWEGYEPTPGKKPYSKGSCRKIKKSLGKVFEKLSKNNEDEYVYHSTYLKNLKSIAQHGLNPLKTKKSPWGKILNPHFNYFAATPGEASDYAEAAEFASEKDLDNIVIFKVKKKNLLPEHIHSDINVIDDNTNIAYENTVPPHHLELHADNTENQRANLIWKKWKNFFSKNLNKSEGYKPVPGKKAYSQGSCVKKAISAPAIESGEYKGEKLDAHHHNRLGKEYREMARQAISKNDKQSAAKYHVKSLFHFSKATEMGYEPMEEENA